MNALPNIGLLRGFLFLFQHGFYLPRTEIMTLYHTRLRQVCVIHKIQCKQERSAYPPHAEWRRRNANNGRQKHVASFIRSTLLPYEIIY